MQLNWDAALDRFLTEMYSLPGNMERMDNEDRCVAVILVALHEAVRDQTPLEELTRLVIAQNETYRPVWEKLKIEMGVS